MSHLPSLLSINFHLGPPTWSPPWGHEQGGDKGGLGDSYKLAISDDLCLQGNSWSTSERTKDKEVSQMLVEPFKLCCSKVILNGSAVLILPADMGLSGGEVEAQ